MTFIGVIRSATESSTNIVYMVNDMTGDDIVVKKWINENEVLYARISSLYSTLYFIYKYMWFDWGNIQRTGPIILSVFTTLILIQCRYSTSLL